MSREELINEFSTNLDTLRRIGAVRHQRDIATKHLPTHAQMGVLFMVADRGVQTTKDLSQQFGMTSSAVTQLVNGLVKDGLLERKIDARDARRANIELTQKGRDLLVQLKQVRLERIREVFTPLSQEELAQLIKIQAKIVQHWNTVCQTPKNK